MKWLVLYTKPNFEIRVSNALNAAGIKAYCPVYKKIVVYSDRKKKVDVPLLRSYVLVKVDEKDRSKVFSVPGVIRYLFWLGKPAEVRAKEIDLLRNSLNGFIKSISISKLKRGSSYTIPEGPFKGHNGKIVNHAKNKLRLELESLGVLVTLTTV